MASQTIEQVVNGDENRGIRLQEGSPVETRTSDPLAEARQRVRVATDQLLPEYRITDARRPLPRGPVDGYLWGLTLLIERLEAPLDDLQAMVVDGSLAADQAVVRAHELLVKSVPELRFGASLRPRPFYRQAHVPAIAELGRICSIVRRLAEDLNEISDQCGASALNGTPSIIVHLHTGA